MTKDDLEAKVTVLTSQLFELEEQLAERELHAAALDADLRRVEAVLASSSLERARAGLRLVLAEREEQQRAHADQARARAELRRARLVRVPSSKSATD